MSCGNLSLKIGEIQYAAYTLRPLPDFGTEFILKNTLQHGTLLRILFQEVGIGFASLQPKLALGDAPLSELLPAARSLVGRIFKQKFSSERAQSTGAGGQILQQSVRLAFVDAYYRSQGLCAWEGLRIPRSHRLVDLVSLTSQLQESRAGIQRFKIKLDVAELGGAAEFLHRGCSAWMDRVRIRLDFNYRWDRAQVREFLRQCGPGRDLVEFIEDPYPLEAMAWIQDQREFGVAFALDHLQLLELPYTSQAPFRVIVLKPAAQDVRERITWAKLWNLPVVITHYLDHPVGQMGAAWVAAALMGRGEALRVLGLEDLDVHSLRLLEGGLDGSGQYETESFAAALPDSINGQVHPPPGTGLGWDEQWSTVSWSALD